MERPYIMIWFKDDVIWKVRFDEVSVTPSEIVVQWYYEGNKHSECIQMDEIEKFSVEFGEI